MLRYFARIALMAMATTALASPPEGWTDNFEEALKTAKAEKKHVLIDFTGSDWCGWCIKLDKEVFSTPEFKAYAAKSWVLVYIDFPNSSKPRDSEQNKKLAERYEVQGYPTIVLTDAEGNEIGRTGYQEGGPGKESSTEEGGQKEATGYIGHLEGFLTLPRLKAQLEEKLAKATTDDEKRAVYLELAKAASAVRRLGDISAEHVELADPKNEHGLLTELALTNARNKAIAGDLAGALEVLDAFEKKHTAGTGEAAQKYYITRGEVFGAMGQSETDEAKRKDLMNKLYDNFKLAYKAAPTSELGPRIKEWLENNGQKVE